MTKRSNTPPPDLTTKRSSPPHTGSAILGAIFLTPFFLWALIDPITTFSLKYDYQIVRQGGRNNSPFIYSADKNTVCRYNPNNYSEDGDTIPPVYFMSPKTYQGVTYYPIGRLDSWNGFEYVGPRPTMTCGTDQQLLVRRYIFLGGWGDARKPALVFFGLCYATLLVHNLYERNRYNRTRPK